jgi:hypothetical protein
MCIAFDFDRKEKGEDLDRIDFSYEDTRRVIIIDGCKHYGDYHDRVVDNMFHQIYFKKKKISID